MEKLSGLMVMATARVLERCKATPISKSKCFLHFSFAEIYSNVSNASKLDATLIFSTYTLLLNVSFSKLFEQVHTSRASNNVEIFHIFSS